MKFRILAGSHVEHDVTYEKDEIVESDQPLDKIFVNKFEFVVDREDKTEDEPVDATNIFPLAANNNLIVLQRPDGTFDVYDKAEPDDSINEKSLTKAGVKKVVKEFIS